MPSERFTQLVLLVLLWVLALHLAAHQFGVYEWLGWVK